ncbi:RNA polymerase sigma factor [Alistipes sp.]|uniref:RNA polymerase sigma factor n=1 Tax=Alistipes sp. TaxID=1872444 RepID=UPI003AB6F750
MKHDRIIGRQFLEGNDDVCVYLYNSYADQLYAYGCGLGFDRETLKDAIHDVFLNLLARRCELGGVKNIRSYLFRAFYNRLIDFKRHECDTTELTPHLDLRITVSFADSLIDTEQAARLKTMLEHMLNELSPMQKSAIYMRYMYEMEYAEIAEILDVTPHAVRKFVSKGLGKLRSNKERLLLLALLSTLTA